MQFFCIKIKINFLLILNIDSQIKMIIIQIVINNIIGDIND